MVQRLRLGVNIDHVATIRNARGGLHPDPVRAAHLAVQAGADGITAHLREDRRHISDRDIARLATEIDRPLNLEMAATEEMLQIALRHRPHAACLVPEKREERTTEGGLDAARGMQHLRPYVEAEPLSLLTPDYDTTLGCVRTLSNPGLLYSRYWRLLDASSPKSHRLADNIPTPASRRTH